MQALLRALFAAARRVLPLFAVLPLFIGTLPVLGEEVQAGRIVALSLDPISGALFRAHVRALFRSDDGGQRWARVTLPAAVNEGRIAAVAASPKGKGAWYVAGPGFGVLHSENGGRSWEARNDGLPSRNVVAVATHADQPDTVYVYVAESGIFRSEDGGKRWKLMDGGPREPITQFVHSNMPGSMQTGWLFAATATGVARSMDCFCGWHDAGGLNAKVYAVAYAPEQPQRVYAATEKGLFLSANGGEEWTRVKSPVRVLTALAVLPSGTLYAASEGQLLRTVDGAKTWTRLDA